jgi:hypothetical protein
MIANFSEEEEEVPLLRRGQLPLELLLPDELSLSWQEEKI